MFKHNYLALAVALCLCSTAAWAYVPDDEDDSSDGTSTGISALANLDFDSEPSSGWVSSASAGSTAVYDVPEWTTASASNAWTASGAYEVNGSGTLQSISAPSEDSEGNTSGGVLGMIAAWSQSAQYTQTVTLAAGIYKISYAAYNGRESGATSIGANLIGFVSEDGDTYYGTRMAFPFAEWVTEEFYFELTEETSGSLSVGIEALGTGSGNIPALFIDYISIEEADYSGTVDHTSSVETGYSDWGGNNPYTYSANSTVAAEYYSDSYISANSTPLTQTVSGLSAGLYEVQVYATAHMAWQTSNDNQATSVYTALPDIAEIRVSAGDDNEVATDVFAYNATGLNGSEPYTYRLYVEVEDDEDLTIALNVLQSDYVNWCTIQILSLTQYLSADEAKAQYEELLEKAGSTTYTDSEYLNDSLQTVLSGIVSAGTTDITDYSTALNTLQAALDEADASITLNTSLWYDSEKIDCTSSVDEWTTTTTSSSLAYNTWSTESDSYVTNPFVQNWGTSTMESNTTTYYTASAALLAGDYTIAGTIRFFMENSSMTSLDGATFFATGADEEDLSETAVSGSCNSYTAYYAFIKTKATVGSDGLLQFGINVDEDVNFSWVAFKNFVYYPYTDYDLGDATYSITDGSTLYVDEDSVPTALTITWDSADGEGDPEIVSTSATATVDETTTATISAVENGISVALGELSAGEHTVTIPAGVYGWSGETTNDEITITFTLYIVEGDYYFQVDSEDGEYKFWTRGGAWGTEAVKGENGVVFTRISKGDGTYILRTRDRYNASLDGYGYLSGPTSAYTDSYVDYAASWSFEATDTEGTYYIKNSNSNYVSFAAYTYNSYSTYYYTSETSDQSSASTFTLLSEDEYETLIQQRTDEQAAAAAEAAGLTGISSEEELEAYGFIETDVTDDYIVDADCSAGSGWTLTGVGYNGSAWYNSETIETWNCNGTGRQTISDLPEGLYKLTAQAFSMPVNNTSVTDVCNVSYLFASTASSEALKLIYKVEGDEISSASLAALADAEDETYLNTLYIYVADGEELEIGYVQAGNCYASWTATDSWTLTRLDTSADVTISSVGYATLYYGDVDLSIPDDVTAYTVEVTEDGDYAELTEVSETIPAGTGVVLKGDAGTYTFGASAPSASAISNNDLIGADEETTFSEDGYLYYILSTDDDDTVGFYWQSGTSGEYVTSAAHKAVLKVASSSEVKSLTLVFNDATGINSVSAESAQGATGIYTLTGIKVSDSTDVDALPAGLYIINGKKTLIK